MSKPNYHFSGSRAAMNLDEPVYLTKYRANIILPPALQQKYKTSEILIEQALKISGLDLDKLPGVVTQKYKHNDRTYMGTIVDTKVKLTMDFEVNLNPGTLIPYPYDMLRDWSKLIYDPNNALQTLKRDHVGSATISVDDKINRMIKYYEFPHFWLVSQLPPWNLDSTTEGIYKITGLQFQCENQKDSLNG
jgi:hypothetical protein